MASSVQSPRTRLFADPTGKFLHEVVLDSCRRHHAKVAIVDASCNPPFRITYAAFGEMIEMAAAGMVAADIKPGDRVAIFLPNCWEFGVAFYAAMLAGAAPGLHGSHSRPERLGDIRYAFRCHRRRAPADAG